MTTYTWERCDDPPVSWRGGLSDEIVFREGHRLCRAGTWISDQARFGEIDKWVPVALGDVAPSIGDCEDFALGLMLWCAKRGVPLDAMRLYLCEIKLWWKPWSKPFGHAVVCFESRDGALMSDIQCPSVIRWPTSKLTRYRHMWPAAKVVEVKP